MYASNLKLINLRNHKSSFYELEKETLFIGNNGSGKTTILESIFILFSLKSFKKQSFSSAVSFGETFFRIESQIKDDNNRINDIICTFNNTRNTTINDEEIDDISNFLYSNPIACYTPEYLGLLSREQQDRRNFLDKYIFYTDKSYINDIKTYKRITAQKVSEFNKNNIDNIYLDILNNKIIELSKKIYEKRKNFINKINNELLKIYEFIDFDMDKVLIKYSSNIDNYNLLIKENIIKKVYYGVHRDKIDMYFNNKIIEKFSSTGQKKTFILLILLSFIKIIEENRKINIITLLDDFEAALDKKRVSFIKEIFKGDRQILYTSVDNSKLDCKYKIELK